MIASDLRSSTSLERKFLGLYFPVVDLIDILLLDLDLTIDKPEPILEGPLPSWLVREEFALLLVADGSFLSDAFL